VQLFSGVLQRCNKAFVVIFVIIGRPTVVLRLIVGATGARGNCVFTLLIAVYRYMSR